MLITLRWYTSWCIKFNFYSKRPGGRIPNMAQDHAIMWILCIQMQCMAKRSEVWPCQWILQDLHPRPRFRYASSSSVTKQLGNATWLYIYIYTFIFTCLYLWTADTRLSSACEVCSQSSCLVLARSCVPAPRTVMSSAFDDSWSWSVGVPGEAARSNKQQQKIKYANEGAIYFSRCWSTLLSVWTNKNIKGFASPI